MSDTSNLDLIRLTAEALHERAAYIVEHAETIGVRWESEPGRWQNVNLAVLLQKNPPKGLREAFHLLLRAEVPHRRMRVEKEAAPPPCQYCHEPILPEDRDRLQAWVARDFHDECLVRSVAGSAAHQLRECRCFGGVREDPPGMTLREAAKLAYDTFNTMRADAGTD